MVGHSRSEQKECLGGLGRQRLEKNAMGEGAMEKMICSVDAVGRWEEGGGVGGGSSVIDGGGSPRPRSASILASSFH
jgi:hypothetical protein